MNIIKLKDRLLIEYDPEVYTQSEGRGVYKYCLRVTKIKKNSLEFDVNGLLILESTKPELKEAIYHPKRFKFMDPEIRKILKNIDRR